MIIDLLISAEIITFATPKIENYMIQELKVKNFRSFRDEVTFSFEVTKNGIRTADYNPDNDPLLVKVSDDVFLSRFAVIYGANAAGKTNLLNAFEFLFNFWPRRKNSRDQGTGITPFELDDKCLSEPTEFNLKFFVGGEKYWYQLVLNKKEVILENLYVYTSRQPSYIFKRKNDVIEFNQSIEPIGPVALEHLNLNCLSNMSLFAAKNSLNFKLPKVDTVIEWMKSSLMSMMDDSFEYFRLAERYVQENKDMSNHLLDFLKKADFNIIQIDSEVEKREIPEAFLKDILSDPDAPEELKERLREERGISTVNTFFHHQTETEYGFVDHRFPSAWQSRGTKCVFSIEAIVYMTLRSSGFVLIDEMERSLHPDLIRYIIERFVSTPGTKSQILISSHFTPLLDMESLRYDCFWFAEKDRKTGSTSLTPLVKKNSLKRRRSIEDGYIKAGNFGARPDFNK